MALGEGGVGKKEGWVRQVGEPLELYGRPANKFVAGFIGAPAMNFIEVTVRSAAGGTSGEGGGLRLPVGPAAASALVVYSGRRAILGVRPEHLALGSGAP